MKGHFRQNNLKKNNDHKRQKQLTEIIYGRNACLGCLNSEYNDIKNREIYSIYLLQSKFDEYFKQIPETLKKLVKKCNAHELFTITHEQDKHQGIALQVSNFKFTCLEEVIDKIDKQNCTDDGELKNKKATIFLLDSVQDPHNVGNIIRSSYCFNIDAIIITEHESCGITSAVVRSSAGYSESSLICRIGNTSLAIEKLKKNGYSIIGFDVNVNTKQDVSNIIKNCDKSVFVFGSEGQGMKKLTKQNCDLIVKLPMNQNAESLNIANTVAIIGWEVMKANLELNSMK